MGAGAIAYKKIKKLLNYNPQIEIIAQEIKSKEIKNLIKKKKVKFKQAQYDKNILDKAKLVIAATNDRKLNSQIKYDTENFGALVNVVDDKKLCEFICPAIIEKSGLQIAITTHGQNPKKARLTRETLEKHFNILNQNIIRLGTRKSPLALAQVDEFITAFQKIKPNQKFEILTFNNQGDKDKKSNIEKVSFCNRLEQALVKKEIDIALHSAKDLDQKINNKLKILALSKSIDKNEALVSKNNLTLKNLPQNARIGASGQRRREQLAKIRPDLKLVTIRGNIGERLELIRTKKLDGIIVAMIALKRLGLSFLASEIISQKIMPAHPLQGSLAIQICADNLETQKLLGSTLTKMKYQIHETHNT